MNPKTLIGLSVLLASAPAPSTLPPPAAGAAAGAAAGIVVDVGLKVIDIILDLGRDGYADKVTAEIQEYKYRTETIYADDKSTMEYLLRRQPIGGYLFLMKYKPFRADEYALPGVIFWIGGEPPGGGQPWCPSELRQYFCDQSRIIDDPTDPYDTPWRQTFSERKDATLSLLVKHSYSGIGPKKPPPLVGGNILFKEVKKLRRGCADIIPMIYDFKAGFAAPPNGQNIRPISGMANVAFEFGRISIDTSH